MLKLYYVLATRFSILLKLVFRNGIRLHPKYLGYLFILFQSSFWSSFLAIREQLIFGRKIKHAKIPEDPIFIIGHWRTGSTFLHQLLQKDPQFTTPSLLQTTYPESFMSSSKFIAPMMSRFLPETRPMDNVKLGVHDPQEDEYALLRLCSYSPLEKLIWPHTSRYFILESGDFHAPEGKKENWNSAITLFAKKLYLHSGKRVVFKNPFNSLRITTLKELFPNAKFIHIYRNPQKVIPSSVNMWTITGNDNALLKKWRPPTTEEVVEGFDKIMTGMYEQLENLPKNDYIEVKFEEMEKDPIKHLQKIYHHFNIEFTDEYKNALEEFLLESRKYKKNKYSPKTEEDTYIKDKLKKYFVRGNYN